MTHRYFTSKITTTLNSVYDKNGYLISPNKQHKFRFQRHLSLELGDKQHSVVSFRTSLRLGQNIRLAMELTVRLLQISHQSRCSKSRVTKRIQWCTSVHIPFNVNPIQRGVILMCLIVQTLITLLTNPVGKYHQRLVKYFV